jgi:soluble lytic murein transglycosylase-like protein
VVPLTDGQPDWNSPHWERLGELGESLGLTWGGRWNTRTDRPHFELPKAEAAARHAAGPRPRPAPRDWQQTLFGAHAPTRTTATPPDRSGIVQQIRQEAQRRGVDPDLAVAVATQESSLTPNAVGDNGNSLGVFQLQRAAALDAGIDPDRRGEVAANIRGGVGYLKLQLDREGGNVARALSRYNRGTPTYLGRGDPRYVENVLQYYRPGARTTPQPAAPREWGQELGLQPGAGDGAAGAPAATPRAWGPELFGTVSAPQTDWRAEWEAPPKGTGQPVPRDWAATLFPADAPLR